jgi:phosphatidylglycerophosphate synthase
VSTAVRADLPDALTVARILLVPVVVALLVETPGV